MNTLIFSSDYVFTCGVSYHSKSKPAHVCIHKQCDDPFTCDDSNTTPEDLKNKNCTFQTCETNTAFPDIKIMTDGVSKPMLFL